ncbi:very short patch repair endonuclease [Burkholderia territorii]|uniref:very short patch repair endonuclease n=1 Tax=Burkholderia territorii TaxID=1503055 RepID=UPI0009BE5BD4|nr:DNA mismatch endonuclease Vsr [Burkholderia territorii]
MDNISSELRSALMAKIRGKDTRPELVVRTMLHRSGFRYRLHVGTLPGRPDIVLPRWKTVIFVHGCFWHRHSGCKLTTTPKTRTRFWLDKFNANIKRDTANKLALEQAGWKVLIIWECETRSPEKLLKAAKPLLESRESKNNYSS